MNCRNCGAAMTPVGGRAYFRCAYCLSFEFPETTDEGVAVIGATSEWPCPTCQRPLTAAASDGYDVNYCGQCHGLLTTNQVFSQILGRRRSRPTDAQSGGDVMPIERTELGRRLRCPRCTRKMDCHPYGGGAPAVIDTCETCNLIWLDAGELTGIANHRPAGRAYNSEPALLTSSAGSCRQPESPWRWGGVEPEGGGMGLGDWLDFLLG